MAGLICSLDVRIAYVDAAGQLTGGGYIGLINPVNFTFEQPEPERIQRTSNLRDSFGNVLDEVVRPNPATITMGTDETGDSQVMAWAFSGEVTGYTQYGATVTEATTAVTKGLWTKLPHRQISSLVVQPAGGGTAYVLGTDYIVDLIGGLILPTQSGAIATGNVDVSYTAAALTGDTIVGGTVPSISVRIDGEGRNLATNEPIHIVVPRAVLAASGGLPLIGQEFTSFEMAGSPIKLPGLPLISINKPRAA